MKIRLGFVSNSSSSSFICDITGNNVSGMDITLADAGMVSCINGHTFGEDFLLESLEAAEEQYKKDNGMDDDEYYGNEMRYEVPEKFCPVCTGAAKPQIVERLKKELVRLKVNVEDLK